MTNKPIKTAGRACLRVAAKLSQIENMAMHKRARTVGRLVYMSTRALDDARRLVTAGRCDEAQAALDYIEGKLKTAHGLAGLLGRKPR